MQQWETRRGNDTNYIDSKVRENFLRHLWTISTEWWRHQYKYIIIIFDHYTKFTKLYPLNRATTNKILEIVINKYIPEVGKPVSIITDHGTQFRGRKWRETLIHLGIKTYKTSVYHPNSNPAERVLREGGRILRTYCHSQQRKWEEYLSPACLLYTSRCV